MPAEGPVRLTSEATLEYLLRLMNRRRRLRILPS